MKISEYIKGKSATVGNTKKHECARCGNKNAVITKDGVVVTCTCGTYVILKVKVKR